MRSFSLNIWLRTPLFFSIKSTSKTGNCITSDSWVRWCARSGAGTIHIEPARRHGQCIIHCYSRLAGNKIKSSTRAGKHHDHYFTLLVVFCLRSCRRRRHRRSKITRHAAGVLFHEKRNKNVHIKCVPQRVFIWERRRYSYKYTFPSRGQRRSRLAEF
jgi:hypothetical protein